MKYLNTKPGSIEEIAANMSKHQNESGYQDMFKKELEKAGKGIGSMTPAEKKAFFNKIDDKYKAKNENINEALSSQQKQLLKIDNYITVKGRQYVIDKISFKNGQYHIKAFDKNGNFHKFTDKDVDNVEHWKNSLKVASYDPKNEAVDNPYAVGMAQAMKSTGDKPPLKKSTITKAHDIAKSIKKDEKNEEKDVPKGYHKMPDGTVMKDSEHKKETHSFMTKDMNKSNKDAKGEKEIVDPEPKLKQESMLDAVKNVWQMSAEELEKIKNEAKYMKAQRMSQYKAEDEKNKKGTADTGSKETKVDIEPSVDYKN